MDELAITPTDLVKYMGEDNYMKFREEIKDKLIRIYGKSKGFWLIAQNIEEI
jgi:hypothetical protein